MVLHAWRHYKHGRRVNFPLDFSLRHKKSKCIKFARTVKSLWSQCTLQQCRYNPDLDSDFMLHFLYDHSQYYIYSTSPQCQSPFTPRTLMFLLQTCTALHNVCYLKCSSSLKLGWFLLAVNVFIIHQIEKIVLKVIPIISFLCVVIVVVVRSSLFS